MRAAHPECADATGRTRTNRSWKTLTQRRKCSGLRRKHQRKNNLGHSRHSLRRDEQARLVSMRAWGVKRAAWGVGRVRPRRCVRVRACDGSLLEVCAAPDPGIERMPKSE
eukprot:3705704-Pleurochrysis_carterae.AAC.1